MINTTISVPIADLVRDAATMSDMLPPALQVVAETFLEAHWTAPYGLSVEIGTRAGGSAALQIALLGLLYDHETRPMIFTVDPYGGKPYRGGDTDTIGGIYGDVDYIDMKQMFRSIPNHAHWYMRGVDFFTRMHGASYWYRGVERRVGDYTFALLDGDHDANTILRELQLVWPEVRPGGAVVVDNVDSDPMTLSVLRGFDVDVVGTVRGRVQGIVRKPGRADAAVTVMGAAVTTTVRTLP